MAECAGSATIIHDDNFETGYTVGGFAGINMKACNTCGIDGNWAVRSEGSQSQIDNGWLGSAFGIVPGFTEVAVPSGIIAFDLLPATYVAPGGGLPLINFFQGLVNVAALGHRFGTSGDQLRYNSIIDSLPASTSPFGANPQTATWRHVEFAFVGSTLSLDGSVWKPNSDGSISVTIDGVEVFAVTGLKISGDFDWPSNQHTAFTHIKIGAAGTLDNLVVTQCDAIAEPEPTPPPNPTPCDCTPGTPGDPDDEIPPTPGPIIPPVLALCPGGGLVPEGGEYVSPETWWGL